MRDKIIFYCLVKVSLSPVSTLDGYDKPIPKNILLPSSRYTPCAAVPVDHSVTPVQFFPRSDFAVFNAQSESPQ